MLLLTFLEYFCAELVVLQRTEQILKNNDRNLDEFLTELERQKGVEVYFFHSSLELSNLFNFIHSPFYSFF